MHTYRYVAIDSCHLTWWRTSLALNDLCSCCPGVKVVGSCKGYSVVRLKRGQLSLKLSRKAHHSSPVWARYGVSFLDSNCDSDPVTAVLYAISCYIGQCYDDTQMYSDQYWLVHISACINDYTTPASRLFLQKLVETNFKLITKSQHRWPLWGLTVDTPHQRPMMQKYFPCYTVILRPYEFVMDGCLIISDS